MKKLYSLYKTLPLLFLLLAFGKGWGQTTVTYSFSSSSSTSGSLDSNINFTTHQNSGTSTPIVSSNQLRLYQNSTKGGSIKINALNGVTITQVVMNVATSGDGKGPKGYSVDNTSEAGTFSESTSPNTMNVSATDYVEFYNKGNSSSMRTYVNSFSVTYTLPSTCTPPTTQASSFTSSSITQTTATAGWTRGNGNNVLVVARAGSAVNADPTSGTAYTASSAFGAGTQIGTGNYVVYNGTGTSVNLTGLTAGTTYHFAVYEYATADTCFNTTELTGNLTTLPNAPAITSTLTASGNVGSAFSYAIMASNTPTSYNATGLPSGLSVNTTTGAISGTPTTTGTYNVTISATNSGGTGTATLVITIGAAVNTCINESFESGLPTSYSSGNVTLSSGTWNGTNIIRGTTGVNSGSYSLQLQSANGSQITSPTLENVKKIEFYSTNSTSGSFQVNISTDDGATWSAAPGSPFSQGTTATFRSIDISTSGVNKVQIYRTAGTLYIDNVVINCQASTDPKATITGALTESTLDGATVSLTLDNETFADATLNAANFTLNNAPSGVTISGVAYNSSTSATVTLAYNGTDFDANFTNFSVNIAASELTTSTSALTSNALTITAVTEMLSATSGTLAFGTVCNGSSAESSFTITGTNLKAGAITLSAVSGYTYSLTSGGTAITGFTQSGGSLSQVIYVTLTPTVANAAYNGSITISGAAVGASNINKGLSGNSTVTAQSVTTHTSSANNVTYQSANLRAAATTLGTCPASTERGFVYSVKATNAIPEVGGTGVTKLVEPDALASNAYAENTGNVLAEGTTYVYQAYIYNGTTYVYGGVQEFTTSFNLTLNTVTGTKACLTNTGGTISWTAPANGATPTGYMLFAVTGATTPSGTMTTALTDYGYANSNYSATTNNAIPTTLGKLLYKGNATSVDITGLTEGQNYSFLVLSYQDGGSVRRFNTAANGGRALDVIADDDVKTFTGVSANTQVTLNWTYNGNTGVTSCFDEVLIVANQGTVTFTPSGDGSTYTANNVYSSSNQVVYKGNGTSRTITGLTNGTEYCFKIWVRRGTIWSDGTTVCVTPDVTYCSVTGGTNNSGITNVSLNTINITSSSNPGYTDNTSISTNLMVGEQYDLSVSVNTNGGYTSYVKVWIDWNRNGVFDNSSSGNEAYELGTTTTNGQPNNSPLTITVPTNAAIGNVRMRVIANTDNVVNGYATPCTSFTYGEVEDYTLNIERPVNAEINVKGNDITIPNGFDAPYGLNLTLFGARNINTNSASNSYTIENLGASALNLTGSPVIQITGANASDFTVTQQATTPLAGSTTTNSTTTFGIRFRPSAAGLRTAYVRIENNDSDENPYVFAIAGTGTCSASYTADFYPNNGPVNTVVAINNSIQTFWGASVSLNGELLTPVSLTGTEIRVKIPVGAVSGNLVVHLADGCTITRYFTVLSSDSTNCETESGGTFSPGNLFISQVTDSALDAMSYIELYNGTGSAVNLGGYNLRVYNNGSSSASRINLNNVTLANNSTYVVAIGVTNPTPVCTSVPGGDGSYANQTSGVSGINFNYQSDPTKGHDHIALFNGNTKLDSWGVYLDDTWANGLGIGASGASFSRKSSASIPNTTFNANDWDIENWGTTCESQNYSNIGTFTPGIQKLPTITTQPEFFPSCAEIALSVDATEGIAGGNGLEYQWYVLPSGSSTWTALSNGGVYSGVTTQHLFISSTTGLNNYQYYCQVRENTSTCYRASEAVLIKDAETRWTAGAWTNDEPGLYSKVIIEDNYDTEERGELNACTLTVNSGILTVKEDYPVTVVNEVINNAAPENFIIENNASLIQVNDAAVNTGNITVHRESQMKKNNYTYWSSPVSGQNLWGFSPGTSTGRFYWYNEADNKFYTNGLNSSSEFAPGKGYAIMAPSNYSATDLTTFDGKFTGVPNNGTKNTDNTDLVFPLQLSSGTNKGFNLIGNPYPSNIDFEKLYALNSTKIYNTAYFWTNVDPNRPGSTNGNGSAYSGNAYAIYTGTGGVPGTSTTATSATPTQYIKVGQGFIVKAREGQNGQNLIFNNSIRTATGTSHFFSKENQPSKDRFWLTLTTPADNVNTILIGYIPNASNGFERDYDAPLMSVASDSFYSLLDTNKLAIQGRSYPLDTEDVVPLGTKHYESGSYTLSLGDHEGIFASGQVIYLKDKETGIITDLTAGSYTFTSEPGEFTNRFEIMYKPGATLAIYQPARTKTEIFTAGNEWGVRTNVSAIKEIAIYDMSGRLLLQKSFGLKEVRIEKGFLPDGIYVLRILLNDDSYHHHKVRK